MDKELERFKTEISLVDLAQSEYGYELVQRESSAASKILKAGGDKVVVTRQEGHDVYFNVADPADKGSVIDFVQRRTGLNLGQLRKTLRAWLPGAKKPAIKRPARAPEHPREVTKDRADVLRRWAALKPYKGSYLIDERGIDQSTIDAFEVQQDERGNAIFAHRTGDGVVGWEVKNKSFTGFAAGGERSVWLAKPHDGPVTEIVITESAIDAMSHAQLFERPGAVYVSTSGTALTDLQRKHLTQLMSRPGVAKISLAMDADAAGETMASELRQIAPEGPKIAREAPKHGKDWNGALLIVQSSRGRHYAREQEQERGLRM